MAKSKSTRRQRAVVLSLSDRNDRLRMDLIGVNAAVMTTVQLLRGRGVDDYLATNLIRAAVNPLERLMAELEGRS